MLYRLIFSCICTLATGLALAESISLKPNETYFLLVRHGETEWNAQNRSQGQTDTPLNETGIAQAEALGKQLSLHHPDIAPTLYSSDLQRAYVTAQKTAEQFQITHIVQMRDLREYGYGIAEGMKKHDRDTIVAPLQQQLKEHFPDRNLRWSFSCMSGAETLNAMVERSKQALAKIAFSHPGEKVAVFGHGRMISTLMIDALDLNIDNASTLPNCAVMHFIYAPDDVDQPLKFIKIEKLIE